MATKTKKAIKKVVKRKKAVKIPTQADVWNRQAEFQAAVLAAEDAFNRADNAVDAAEAELEMRTELRDDAENDLFDAESDLDMFNDLVEEASATGNWAEAMSLKPMKW